MDAIKRNTFIRSLCTKAPIIPVLVQNDSKAAIPLAAALVAGGLPVLEVTLRTENALEVISEMAKVKGGIVGAGTLITPHDVHAAKQAGATFGVSPGGYRNADPGLRRRRSSPFARCRNSQRGHVPAGTRL